MSKAIATLIKAEMDWMKEAQRDFGNLLVDPHTVVPGSDNPALKRVFDESGLDEKNSEHWKLLLAAIADVAYKPAKAGPGRPVFWNPERCHALLDSAFRLRIEDPNKSVEAIAYDLADSKTWKGHGVDRERIQRLLTEVRAKHSTELTKIADHTKYKLGAPKQFYRDVAWAFSKDGKAELKRRQRNRPQPPSRM